MINVTVITVNFNNSLGLRRTVESIMKQDSLEFECLVIDGGSSDASCKVLDGLNDKRVSYVSEIDDGIFDAMNKGFRLASGEWVIFMNSGDVFYRNDVISQFVNKVEFLSKSVEVAYGDCVLLNTNKIHNARTDVSCLKKGETFASHQSMFFRTKQTYDLRYSIFGDLDLLSAIYKFSGSEAFFYLEFPVAIYEGGGISDSITQKKRIEKLVCIYRRFGVKSVFTTYFLNMVFYRKLFNAVIK